MPYLASNAAVSPEGIRLSPGAASGVTVFGNRGRGWFKAEKLVQGGQAPFRRREDRDALLVHQGHFLAFHLRAAHKDHQFPGPGGDDLGSVGDGVAEDQHQIVIFRPGGIDNFGIEARVAHDIAGKIHGIAHGAVGRDNFPELGLEHRRRRRHLKTRVFPPHRWPG